LDPTLARTGERSERNLVVLHHDVEPGGALGPGQIEMGPVVPEVVARFLSCDAKVQVLTYRLGRLVGINPAERTPNRATRRYLARRDQGCTHPLCAQRRWLHAHHIVHWADNGVTEPANLILLCPRHHRALHHGEFSIDGNPETGTLRFLDPFGTPIQPPDTQPPPDKPPPGPPGGQPPGGVSPGSPPSGSDPPSAPPPGGASPLATGPPGSAPPGTAPRGTDPPGDAPRCDQPSPFTPPLAERLPSDSFTWN
jgi:hypothetical protein